MSELLAAYWSQPGEIESPLSTKAVNEPGVGPHSVFSVWTLQLQRQRTSATQQRCIEPRGEALSTWVVDDVVQEQIHRLHQCQLATTPPRRNHGGYPFAREHLFGAVSSFGAAKITVGRDRFSLWAERLLARQVLESLSEGHLRLSPLADRSDDDPEKEQIETLGQHYADRIHRGAIASGDTARGYTARGGELCCARGSATLCGTRSSRRFSSRRAQQGPGEHWEQRLKAQGGRLG